MSTLAPGMEHINKFSYKKLNASLDSFQSGNMTQGFDNFKLVYPPHQNKVYEQIWIDRGRPQGNPEYGRQTFNDTDGLSSTMQEKAEAIDRCLESIEERKNELSAENQRNFVGSNWELRPTGNGDWKYYDKNEPRNFDKVWVPTTKDECLQAGIAMAAIGTVAVGAYAVYQVFQAIKGAIR